MQEQQAIVTAKLREAAGARDAWKASWEGAVTFCWEF